MAVRLLVDDCRAMLATLPDASVHACITSPPYYGLRAYGTNPQVWGGDPDGCAHEWGDESRSGQRLRNGQTGSTLEGGRNVPSDLHPTQGAYCTRCGAWRGELGSEPTPEQYVANLVAVFREVRRVLHPSGVCIVNLGDSYAGSGKGPTGHNGIGDQAERQGFSSRATRAKGGLQGGTTTVDVSYGGKAAAGYKAKDLMQMPFKVAEALRQDGWHLRSAMPWLKRAAMPESVTDRPSNALEWLFLFSKAPRYYWDAEAIRQTQTGNAHSRGNGITPKSRPMGEGVKANESFHAATSIYTVVPGGRAFRNTDPWFLSLDAAIADARADLARLEAMRATGGVLTDDDGLPLAVDINPAAYKEAHFATYPPALVIPFVKAGTSERGCCLRCLAPYSRVVERERIKPAAPSGNREVRRWDAEPDGQLGGRVLNLGTSAWVAGCACDAGEPIPTTVLDCFAGSGTTLLVADRLARDAVGIELSPEYARMAEARIAGDAPLLNGLSDYEAEAIEDKQGALGKRTYTGFNARWKAKQDGMAEVETTTGDYAPLGLFEEAAS